MSEVIHPNVRCLTHLDQVFPDDELCPQCLNTLATTLAPRQTAAVEVTKYDGSVHIDCGRASVYVDTERNKISLPVDWDGEIEPGVVPDLIACLVRVLPGWRL